MALVRNRQLSSLWLNTKEAAMWDLEKNQKLKNNVL